MQTVIIRSRAVAAFISLSADVNMQVQKAGFVFDSQDGKTVMGKSFRVWEREFSRSELSRFNALLKSLGDEQRQLP